MTITIAVLRTTTMMEIALVDDANRTVKRRTMRHTTGQRLKNIAGRMTHGHGLMLAERMNGSVLL